MGLRSYLFSRRGQKQPSATEPLAAAPVDAAAAPSTDTAQGTSAAPAPLPVAIRSLTRYQHDPAFKNFQQKLRRSPGMAAAHGRRRADYDAQRQRPQDP